MADTLRAALETLADPTKWDDDCVYIGPEPSTLTDRVSAENYIKASVFARAALSAPQGQEVESSETMVGCDGGESGSGLPALSLAEEFGDPETLLNSREWLQKALEAKRAKVVGGGCGCGQADLDIELEGCKFNVSIRPL